MGASRIKRKRETMRKYGMPDLWQGWGLMFSNTYSKPYFRRVFGVDVWNG